MSKETAKKNLRKNEMRMHIFNLFTLAVNVISLASIIYHRGSLPYFRDILGTFFWAGQQLLALTLLKQFAKPRCSSTGELLECPDASNPSELGLYSLAQDLLWVCWVVQLLCNLFHWGFVVFYFPIPALILYKVWGFIAPLLFRGQSSADDVGGSSSPPLRAERRRREILRRKGKTVA